MPQPFPEETGGEVRGWIPRASKPMSGWLGPPHALWELRPGERGSPGRSGGERPRSRCRQERAKPTCRLLSSSSAQDFFCSSVSLLKTVPASCLPRFPFHKHRRAFHTPGTPCVYLLSLVCRQPLGLSKGTATSSVILPGSYLPRSPCPLLEQGLGDPVRAWARKGHLQGWDRPRSDGFSGSSLGKGRSSRPQRAVAIGLAPGHHAPPRAGAAPRSHLES